ncbi:MAG: hypothetical protein N2595_08570 [bacterium]|nr:hypothetical protein [bacterium]
MKRAMIVIWSMVWVLTGAAEAGQVTSWSDTFTGPDGTVVAPSFTWWYTNLGVERSDWQTYPRPDAQDKYILTNNQLFCYVGPCTNDPAVYNKVQAGLQPLSDGTPVWMLFTNGQVEAEIQINQVTANAGNQWNLNQELKLTLAAGPAIRDPGPYTNMYFVKATVRPSTLSNMRIVPQYALAVSNWNREISTVAFVVPYPLTEPVRVKYVVKSDTTWIGYTNGALWFVTNDLISADKFQTVYPFIWHGKFNGAGGVSADGTMVVDNFSVGWIPEPGLLVVLLGVCGVARKIS